MLRIVQYLTLVLSVGFVSLPAIADMVNYGQVFQAGNKDVALAIIKERIPNLSRDELKKLKALGKRERKLEDELTRTAAQENDEHYSDIAVQLMDIGLERIRILTGKQSAFFVGLRNKFNDGLGQVMLAGDSFASALEPYATNGSGSSNVWSKELGTSCFDFMDESKLAILLGLFKIETIVGNLDELLAKFDHRLLDAIVSFRSTGSVPEGLEMKQDIELMVKTAKLLNNLAELVKNNNAKAEQWKTGSPCPVADRVEQAK